MPDIAEPPASTTPAATPSQTPASTPSGDAPKTAEPAADPLGSLMDEYIKSEPAKGEKKKDDKPTEKKETKPAEKPADKAATDKKVEPVKEKDPVQLRKKLAEIEQEYSGFKLTATQEAEKLKQQIAAYEKRPYLTDEQKKRYDDLEKRSKELEAKLYARDYSESDEFKKEYTEKGNKLYKTALQRVTGLTVTYRDGEEEKQRQATPADFQKVFRADPTDQYAMATQIFGQHAHIVLQDINNLRAIQEAAEEAVTAKRQNWETERAKLAEEEQGKYKAFNTQRDEAANRLKEKYPKLFAESPDTPEENTVMQKVRGLIEESRNGGLPLAERAERIALIESYATATPRLILQNQKLMQELQAKDEELIKYRGSDPGNAGETGAAEPAKDEEADLDKMEERINRI